MKKSILIALILIIAGASANAQNKQGTSKVTHLNYSEFINKVWDFEKNPNNFVYKGKLPAIIDFYADWCGPCRAMSPVLDEIANEYDGKLVVYKVNVEGDYDWARLFQIQYLPTILFITADGRTERQVGAMDKDGFKGKIGSFLIK